MTRPDSARTHSGSEADAVDLAVFASRLRSIVRKMTNTLHRTGRSGVLNMARDFSCCVITNKDELLMPADSLPIHVMSGPDLMARALKRHHPVLRAGDAFLHNSPYEGNSHAADHSLLVPVVDDEGTHRCTVLVKAHQADCGNSAPTTYMGSARDVYEEGALIFSATQVQRDYQDCDDILRMCRARIRVPEQWAGDFLGMVGAARIGELEMQALARDLGWDVIHLLEERWFDYSEARMIAALNRLPPGTVTALTVHDPCPGAPDGIPLSATVEVKADEARVTVDLTANIDCLPNGYNLSEATARTAAFVGVFNSLAASVPPNAGSFRRLDVKLRAGCVCGIPAHPTSTSAATTGVADRVANAVQRAIAMLGEGYGLADTGGVIPASCAVISGRDPETGHPFINQLMMVTTGGAGGPQTDGWLTIAHVGNGGMLFRDSIELDELKYPLVVWEQQLVPDTEGAGQFRGAPSARVEYGPVPGARFEVMYGTDGTVHAAEGVRGGGPGGTARHQRRRSCGTLEELPGAASIVLEAGETIIARTTGGGGYGPATKRPLARVEHDVREGWITAQRAREVYGVSFDAEQRAVRRRRDSE